MTETPRAGVRAELTAAEGEARPDPHSGRAGALDTRAVLEELTAAAQDVVDAGFVCSPDLWQRLQRATKAARAVLEVEALEVDKANQREIDSLAALQSALARSFPR